MCVHNMQHEDTWEILIAKVPFPTVVYLQTKKLFHVPLVKKMKRGKKEKSPFVLHTLLQMRSVEFLTEKIFSASLTLPY